MKRWELLTAGAFLAGVAMPAPSGAQEPELAAGRVDGPNAPVLDGRLTEAAWRAARPAPALRQREPLEGGAPTEATTVRVIYTDDALYIGVHARDADPAGVVDRVLQRDRVLEVRDGGLVSTGDDVVAVLLDTFHDHRSGVVFATNARGARFDALVSDDGATINTEWDGVWEVAGQRVPDGWTAELRIPLRTLRYDPAATGPWGINVLRVISRRSEQAVLAGWSRDAGGFERPSRAGHLAELAGLPGPGLNVDAKAFALARSARLTPAGGTPPPDDRGMDLGLDLKYEIRPGLVLDATVNTDFAQADIDEQQVNLTRFDLFLPEKREFFLENAGTFVFGAPSAGFESPPLLLFFSRRIGLDGGRPVPVLGGARVSGRVGPVTVGALDIVTDGAGASPRTNFFVARAKRDVGASGYLGAMLVDRRADGAANTAAGLDASLWPTVRTNVQAFIAGTASRRTVLAGAAPAPTADSDGLAYRVRATHDTDRWGVAGEHLAVGPAFEAEAGFVGRTDLRRTGGTVRWSPRPERLGIRRIDAFLAGTLLTDLGGDVSDWDYGLTVMTRFDSGDLLGAWASPGFTRVAVPFRLAGRLDVPAGDYDRSQVWGTFGTSPARVVRFSGNGGWEAFFGGDRRALAVAVEGAAGPHVAAEAILRRDWVSLPAGDLETTTAQLRFALAASTRLSTDLVLQYNSLEETVFLHARINLIHRPGSDLFLVLQEGRREVVGLDDPFGLPASRGAVAKLTWLVQL